MKYFNKPNKNKFAKWFERLQKKWIKIDLNTIEIDKEKRLGFGISGASTLSPMPINVELKPVPSSEVALSSYDLLSGTFKITS